MSQGKTLLKNTAIVSIGKICTQLITFFLLSVYTAVLTREEYGVVDLLNTLTGLFLPIITLQIEQGVFRYLIDCRDDEEKKTIVITTVMRFSLIQAFLYIMIFICASFFIKNQYKYFLMANLIICIFSSILLQICRGLGDNKKYAIGSFISGVSTVILNLIFIVVFHWGAYGMIGATIIANFMCFLYIFISKKIFEFINLKKYSKNVLKEILKYSLPLIPNMISWWIVNVSDRTIITLMLDIGQNGIYSVANKFTHVFTSLYSVFNLTWTESASLNVNSENKNDFFSRILDVTIRFFGAFSMGIIAFMPFVFPILINEKFKEAYNQIPILMIASIFNVLVSFIGTIYVAKKITKEIAKTSIFAAIINITINLLLIKYIGLYAASISTLVAYLSMFIYRYIDSRKYVKLTVNKKLISSMIILIIVSIIVYYLHNEVIQGIVAVIVTIYAIIINKNSAKFILQTIYKKIHRDN